MDLHRLLSLVERDYRVNARRSIKTMLARAKHLERLLGPGVPTGEDVERFKEKRLVEERAAASTVRSELSVLRRGFRLAQEVGEVESVPTIRDPVVRNVRATVCTVEQLRQIVRTLEVLDADFCDAIKWIANLGWRRNQALGLTWAEVAHDRSWVLVPGSRTKNGQPHQVALGSAPRAILEARWELRAGDYVFHRGARRGRIYHFDGPWRRATRAAGCEGLRVHDLRRVFAGLAVDAGQSESAIMATAGWASPSAFRRYLIRPSGAQVECQERVADRLALG